VRIGAIDLEQHGAVEAEPDAGGHPGEHRVAGRFDLERAVQQVRDFVEQPHGVTKRRVLTLELDEAKVLVHEAAGYTRCTRARGE
jgi:hypothetical protein